MNAVEILLSDTRGIYIPRDFVESFDQIAWGIEDGDEDWETCKDPDSEWYWDAWDSILDKAKHQTTGHTLYQDGDLFALNVDEMTWEELKSFDFEIPDNICLGCNGEMTPNTGCVVHIAGAWAKNHNICSLECANSMIASGDWSVFGLFQDERHDVFSHSECDMCGTTLGGERYFVVDVLAHTNTKDEHGNTHARLYQLACIDCWEKAE